MLLTWGRGLNPWFLDVEFNAALPIEPPHHPDLNTSRAVVSDQVNQENYKPNRVDYYVLRRAEQVAIFRLRIGHRRLNENNVPTAEACPCPSLQLRLGERTEEEEEKTWNRQAYARN